MTWRRRRMSRGHRAPRRDELAAARHVDPSAYAVFRGCARKRRFETEAAASAAGAEAGLRYYGPCRYCGGWHLTSQQKRVP